MQQTSFTRFEVLALLWMGVACSIFLAMQAILLPQLVQEGRLTLAQLGQVSTAEAMGTGIALTLASAMVRPESLRLYVLVAALSGLAMDAATPGLSGMAVVGARFVHGLCAGVLMWVWIGFLMRSANPARWAAIYVTVQSALGMVLASLYSAVIFPAGGATAGFLVLAGFYALIVACAAVVPRRYEPFAHSEGPTLPDIKGLLCLFAVVVQIAAILAMWVYYKSYGAQIGLDDKTTGSAISLAFAGQIAGGLLATALAGRVRGSPMIVLSSACSIVLLAMLLATDNAVVYMTAGALFALFWMLGSSFQMPYLIEADPSRRAALHMGTAQLLGVAAGPAVASLVISGSGASGALTASLVLYAVAGLIVAATGRHRLPAAGQA